jgi:hypothetical protein
MRKYSRVIADIVSELNRATEEAREICFKTYQMSEAEKFSLGENSDRNNLEDDTSRLAKQTFSSCNVLDHAFVAGG